MLRVLFDDILLNSQYSSMSPSRVGPQWSVPLQLQLHSQVAG
jgi:hypothetical protein